MTNKRKTTRIGKKKQKKRKKVLLILIPILLIIGAGVTYAGMLYQNAKELVTDSYEDDGRDSGSDLREDQVNPDVDDVSILFVGVDQGAARQERYGEVRGLSDALILATFNKEEKSVKMLSIPRDSYVYVPGMEQYTKINHAHSNGGIKYTIDTVENLFDVPIDYWVRVNFDAFIDIVDTLDGIQVDVPYELQEMDSNDSKNAIHLLPGQQWLNGEEALALARTRKLDNDIERGKRQQEIIRAIVDRAVSINTLFNLENLMQAVGNNMTTNMSFNEMMSFTSFGMSGELDIESYALSGNDLWTENPRTYYYQLDEEDLAEKQQVFKEHLGLVEPTFGYTEGNDTEEADNF
ncbi:transcriptional attenuator, LytR family [Amphibacillus marinus]|uniref:Transcriptional attenuator, LytR family n=1 Tax=Amphibacillus marinus TaxID=872970 RepID=A0A1H8N5L2_9BACI|nr:LCP family protein [Amphibacillus marinus]SEO24733.1 transcriptional attenuator, LytR family [Amphibacillus marinus]